MTNLAGIRVALTCSCAWAKTTVGAAFAATSLDQNPGPSANCEVCGPHSGPYGPAPVGSAVRTSDLPPSRMAGVTIDPAATHQHDLLTEKAPYLYPCVQSRQSERLLVANLPIAMRGG